MLDIDLIRPLADLVASHAAQYGDKMAFRDAERLVTYGQLYARTARLAGHLQDRGLTAGGRVILHLENSVETVEGYLAITRADGVGVCICQWPIGTACGRPAEMPAGGHENCPLMANRSAHQGFGGVGHVEAWAV